LKTAVGKLLVSEKPESEQAALPDVHKAIAAMEKRLELADQK